MEQRKVFHAGERAFQETHGVADRMAEIGAQVIRPLMPQQHRDFFQGLSYIFVGALDVDGRPWATLAVGGPGFIQSPTETRLGIAAEPLALELLGLQTRPGDMVGLLGLDLTNRRRNRMNGVVAAPEQEADEAENELKPVNDRSAMHRAVLDIDVVHSFGNCPKYIQTREVREFTAESAVQSGARGTRFTSLTPEVRAMLARSDSFFIASVHRPGDGAPDHAADAGAASPAGAGVDISHRGGPPGFVRIKDETTLTFDDYPGNLFYNTLGNLLLNPAAGLLFVDFDHGDLFFLSGRAKIHDYTPLESEAVSRNMPRGKILRRVSFELREGYHVPGDGSLRWPLREYSPALPVID